MAKEADFSDCEFFADEGVDVDSGGDDIASKGGGAKGSLDDFSGNSLGEIVVEKGDLAFVVGLVVVEAIADNTASGDEFELIFLDDFVRSGGHSVVAFVVMALGEVEVMDFKSWHLRCSLGLVKKPLYFMIDDQWPYKVLVVGA